MGWPSLVSSVNTRLLRACSLRIYWAVCLACPKMKTNRKTMKTSVPASAEAQNLFDIRKLVLEGEGQHTEFKRKAAHPEKIVREFIAFANTDGGTLLIGVDDDGSIHGVKYPEEEIHVITAALQQTCRPLLVYQESVLPISENRSVIRYDISPSENFTFWISMINVKHLCVCKIWALKRVRKCRKSFADQKRNVMCVLSLAMPKKPDGLPEQNPNITLQQYMKFSGLNRFLASRKLILLVLASVLKITASEKGDLYSRV